MSRATYLLWMKRLIAVGLLLLIILLLRQMVLNEGLVDFVGATEDFQPAQSVVVELDESQRMLGGADAETKIVVYANPISEAAGYFFQQSLKPMIERGVRREQISMVLMPWPRSGGAASARAARALIAAGNQDLAWRLAEKLWNRPALSQSRETLIRTAAQLGAERRQFIADLDSKQTLIRLEHVRSKAQTLHLSEEPGVHLKRGDRQEFISGPANGELAETLTLLDA